MKRPRKTEAAVVAEPRPNSETLVAWSERRAAWARDALRRHAGSRWYALSDADKAAIVERVRHAAGLSSADPLACEPLSAGHVIATTSSQQRIVLYSLGPVRHLNRLAPDQRMRFAIDGLTVVFGDNGSGKSGYARVAKKMCRSLSKDDLLNNVFEEGAKAPPEIVVRYQVEGEEVSEVTWTDGTPPPEPLGDIAVFDSTNARLYVDRENRISYLPPDISLLQRHGEHCAEMDGAFKAELVEIRKRLKVPLPSGYVAGGTIAQVLARLDSNEKTLPTADQIKALAAARDGDLAELQRLERFLANDSAELAARQRRAKMALEQVASQFADAPAVLSDEQATALQGLQDEARTTAEASSLAASERFASEPLKEVGSEAWRLMYDCAKAFAVSIGSSADKLPDQAGDPCALCQEPLSEIGAARLKAFNDFVKGKATRLADAARQACSEAIQALRALQIPAKVQASQTLAEFAALSDARRALASEIGDYCEAAIRRRDAMMKATRKDDFAVLPDLKASPANKIMVEAAALETEAKAYDDAATDDGARAGDRIKLAELRDRKKLADDLEIVLARLDDLGQISKLKQCCTAVDTGPISRQITALRRSLVMEGLRKAIEAEVGALDLSHIPFQISDHSNEGQSLFGVGLKAANEVANNKVLSEGEQRALALACFLAEATAAGNKCGLIIDDPVSSLDQGRIRRVATRIVTEAGAGRQVIVFTHNILFFNELCDAAARASPQVPVLRNFISKSAALGFGIVSESDEPWILQSVTKRVAALRERLKGYANVNDFETDAWRKTVTDYYTALRETWERLVEEVLLGKVIERFNSDVRTQSLSGVVVENDDYATIYHAMKRVSERSGHDMAVGRAVAVPKPSDMKTDLDELDAFREKVQKRKNDTAKKREVLQKAPMGKVG